MIRRSIRNFRLYKERLKDTIDGFDHGEISSITGLDEAAVLMERDVSKISKAINTNLITPVIDYAVAADTLIFDMADISIQKSEKNEASLEALDNKVDRVETTANNAMVNVGTALTNAATAQKEAEKGVADAKTAQLAANTAQNRADYAHTRIDGLTGAGSSNNVWEWLPKYVDIQQDNIYAIEPDGSKVPNIIKVQPGESFVIWEPIRKRFPQPGEQYPYMLKGTIKVKFTIDHLELDEPLFKDPKTGLITAGPKWCSGSRTARAPMPSDETRYPKEGNHLESPYHTGNMRELDAYREINMRMSIKGVTNDDRIMLHSGKIEATTAWQDLGKVNTNYDPDSDHNYIRSASITLNSSRPGRMNINMLVSAAYEQLQKPGEVTHSHSIRDPWGNYWRNTADGLPRFGYNWHEHLGESGSYMPPDNRKVYCSLEAVIFLDGGADFGNGPLYPATPMP